MILRNPRNLVFRYLFWLLLFLFCLFNWIASLPATANYYLLDLPTSTIAHYPTNMPTAYVGAVRPEKGVSNYTGLIQPGSGYSTAYLGDYEGGDEGSGNHPGVDVDFGVCGLTPIRAVAAGEIVGIFTWTLGNLCGDNREYISWGNAIVIRHDGFPDRYGYRGTVYSIYSHLYSFAPGMNYQIGDVVLRGTVLGYEGSTGGSSGSHLHFQVDKRHYDDFGAPYWPSPCCDAVNLQDEVKENTFNPMRFVQAHEVYLAFATPAAATYYIDASWGQPTASVS